MKLPSGYHELEYIQSTGTQYIDTGFKPNQDTRVIIDSEVLSTTTDGTCIFGARVSYNNTAFSSWSTTTQIYTDYGSNYQFATFDCYKRFIIDKNKNVQTTNDVSITLASATFQSAQNAYIFAVNSSGPKYYSTIKLYSLKLYNNGTLIRDYIPCINSGGYIGLYDIVNNMFYSNAGTGVFIAGPIIKTLNLPVNVGGIWKDCGDVFVNVGGIWKTVDTAYVNINGTWKEISA